MGVDLVSAAGGQEGPAREDALAGRLEGEDGGAEAFFGAEAFADRAPRGEVEDRNVAALGPALGREPAPSEELPPEDGEGVDVGVEAPQRVPLPPVEARDARRGHLVQGVPFRIHRLRFGVWGVGFRVWGLRCRV